MWQPEEEEDEEEEETFFVFKLAETYARCSWESKFS